MVKVIDKNGNTLYKSSVPVDISGNVTIINSVGVSAVNIQDGGNSITVDGDFLTDTELRASPLDVDTGLNPLTDVELRASPVDVNITGGGGDASAVNQLIEIASLASIDSKLTSPLSTTIVGTVPVSGTFDLADSQSTLDTNDNIQSIKDGIDQLLLSQDSHENTPLFVQDLAGALKRDVNKAILPSDAPEIIRFGGTLSAGITNVIFVVDTTGYQSISIQVTALTTVPSAECSNDGRIWTTVYGVNPNSSTTYTNIIGGVGMGVFPAWGKYFRLSVFGAGTISGIAYLRQQSIISSPFTGLPMNLATINTTAPVGLGSLASNGGVAGTTTGTLVVGSSIIPGSITVPYPIIMGGSDAPVVGALAGKVRTLRTDTSGRATISGVDQQGIGQAIQTTPNNLGGYSVSTKDTDTVNGFTTNELLLQIITELRVISTILPEIAAQITQGLNNGLNNITQMNIDQLREDLTLN